MLSRDTSSFSSVKIKEIIRSDANITTRMNLTRSLYKQRLENEPIVGASPNSWLKQGSFVPKTGDWNARPVLKLYNIIFYKQSQNLLNKWYKFIIKTYWQTCTFRNIVSFPLFGIPFGLFLNGHCCKPNSLPLSFILLSCTTRRDCGSIICHNHKKKDNMECKK